MSLRLRCLYPSPISIDLALFPVVYYGMVHRDTVKRKKPEEKGSVTLVKKGSVTPYVLKGRVWVDGPEGTFIGYGRVVLMERIKENGSITRAAKSMGMSYRHAWELVDSMNNQSPGKPLVITSTGGKKGGGTVVTEYGEQVIVTFWKTQRALKRFLEKEGVRYDLKEMDK